jgi:hypothetical protein
MGKKSKTSVIEEFTPVIFRCLDCSTVHITRGDSDLLERADCPISVDPYEHGHYVFTGWSRPEDTSLPLEREREMTAFGFSPAFVWLMALAYAADCKYLVLDESGTVYDVLPKFEW